MSTATQSLVKAMDSILKLGNMIDSKTRVCIYPKDIQKIMGKEYSQARAYLAKLKTHYKKEPHQFISIEEFSQYSGLKIEHIMRCIVG